MKKKTICILMLLCIGVLVGKIYADREQNIETFNVNSQTEQEIKDELIIAAFIQDIRNKVGEYYLENDNISVAVYNYETIISDIYKKEPGLIQIRFGVTPQVGAHNPVGYDEVTYIIDSSGNKEFVEYQHIKNYTLNK